MRLRHELTDEQRALIDEMHLTIAPVLRGLSEHLLSGIDHPSPGYELAELVTGSAATRVTLTRRDVSSAVIPFASRSTMSSRRRL